MRAPSDSGTSPSLLARLRHSPTDQEAWSAFVERYGPRIYYWCRQWNLQDAEAKDVTQEVLARLAVKMRTFVYDATGSFRGWLKTLTRHTWSDFCKSRKNRRQSAASPEVAALLDQLPAGDSLAAQLEEEFDQELLALAIARVRRRVQLRTWEAFHLMAVEGLSGAEAAARLNLKVTHAFVYKSKVQRMLREEIAKLEYASGEKMP
jgi:RNA polymerase sigma-70 factor (ECF subfamily)